MRTQEIKAGHSNGNGHRAEAEVLTQSTFTQAEVAQLLQQSNEMFRKTVNAVPSMIYQILFRPDGTVVYPFVSEGSKAIYGIEPERIMQDASVITKMWHPDDVGEYMRRVEECRRTLKPFDMECRIVLPDGKIKWLRVRSQPELQPDGGLLFYGVRIDITAQKEAEARLRLQQAQLNAAVDLAKLAFWEGDLQRQCFTFNDQCYVLLGTSFEREGKYDIAIEDYLSRFVLPEDVPSSVQHLQAILASPTLTRGEATYRIRRADDGTIRYIKVIYNVERNADGIPVRLFGPMQDITDLKETEQALRRREESFQKTVNTVPSVIYQLKFNPDGSYSYPFVSDRCQELYEVSAEEAMRDATVLTKMWHPDDVAEYWRQIKHTLDNLVPLDIVMRIITPSGKLKWVRVNSNPEKQPDGSIILYGVRTDITAQKLREQRIAKMQAIQKDITTRPEFYNGDFDSAVTLLTEKLCEGIGVGQAGIWFTDEAITKITAIDVFNQVAQQHFKGTELFAKDFPSYFAALRQERTIVASDAYQHPATAEFSEVYLKPNGIGAMLDVPIRHGGKVLGVICLEHLGGQREWTGEDINFALHIADMVSLALQARERKEAETKLRLQQTQMNVAADLAQLAFWEFHFPSQTFTFNDRYYALLGTSVEKEGSYQMSAEQYFSKFVPAEALGKLMADIQAVATSSQTQGVSESIARRADGELRHMMLLYRVERNPDGSPIRAFGAIQDITQQKIAENKLLEQQAQMNVAADLAKLAFWEGDLQRQVSILNDRCWALLGTSYEKEGSYEIKAQEYFDRFVVPEDALQAWQRMQEALASPTARRGEATYRIRREDDGSLRYINVIYNIDRDASGTPTRVFGAMQDITEQKLAEEKLRNQQMQMNAAADLAKLAFWECDIATMTFQFNERCFALLGTSYEKEGGYQIPVQAYLGRFVLVEDVSETVRHLQAVLASPTLTRGEATYRIQRADDGTIRYIKVIYNVERNADGIPVRLFGPMQDITDLKETEQALRRSEETFRKTVNAVPGMIYQYVILPDGTVQIPYASEGSRDIFGVEPNALTQDPMLLLGMMDPEDAALSQVAVAESAANMTPFFYEARFTLPTGKQIWARFQGKPTKREDGAIVWYGVCIDITKLKALEAELQARIREIQETQKHLIQSEKMSALGQMVAGIAHELNTPIGYAFNNVSLIRERFKNISSLLHKAIEAQECVYNGQLEEAFTKMQEVSHSPNGTLAELDETIRRTDRLFNGVMLGLEQMTNLVKSMRNFSRLDEAEMKKADLNEGVRSCLLMIGHQLKDKNIELTTEYGDIPMVDCFPAQLNQVFLNLIQNAIHAVEEKPEGKIYVSTSLEDGYVVVRVQDNGKGIPKHIQSKIFDPFFTTKPVGKGTGLGLSICYSIVQKHNGKLYFETEEGVGTTFFVKIPAVEFLETHS